MKHQPFHQRSGVRLERLVAQELEHKHICFEHVANGSRLDAEELVDFRLRRHPCDERSVDFQITLLRDSARLDFKIKRFVLAAMQNSSRGLRVFIQIQSHRKDLRYIAKRVAFAMMVILRGDFRKKIEEHRVLGVRLRPGRQKRYPNLSTFSLLKIGWKWAVDKLEKQKKIRLKQSVERLRSQRSSHLNAVRGFLKRSEQVESRRASNMPAYSIRMRGYPKQHNFPIRQPI